MKKLILFTLFSILTGTLFAQTIYTADNNPGAIGGVNVFTGATALQDAIDPAINTSLVAGDIIHVTRSSVNYGDITVTLPLNIFGIGLNPDTDGSQRSVVNIVYIDDPVASGTRLSGLYIVNILNLGGTAGSLSNLLIENSLIRSIQHTSSSTFLSNIIIRNNVIGSGFSTDEEKIDLLAGAISNIIIANNIIYATNFNANQGTVTASNSTSVENNLFIGTGNGVHYSFENFNGNSVKNNIFLGLRPGGIGSFSGNTFKNNISFGTGGGMHFQTSMEILATQRICLARIHHLLIPDSLRISISLFSIQLYWEVLLRSALEKGVQIWVYMAELHL